MFKIKPPKEPLTLRQQHILNTLVWRYGRFGAMIVVTLVFLKTLILGGGKK
jgi:hypothetical protein